MLHSIAFIPDGNRRYATKNEISLLEAYSLGFNKAKQAVEWSFQQPKVDEVTIWGLSTENLNRSESELSAFTLLLKNRLSEVLKSELVHEKEVRVNIVGRLSLLPASVRKVADEITKSTKSYSKRVINLCIAYGGRAELVDAVNRLVRAGKPITESELAKALYLDTEPDLVIRTGNAQRLSGFLPWQTAYSELFFSKKLWPEFEESDFIEAVKDFNLRQRRFGK
ncbi:MAG: di-trans,poly-cis-decaprenylcistransferase [Candidatus Diapherotrites archaeon]|nr:di-trans,poly-cis-decaprenylcistransferase [Candidatus Diapherotrites archaeon]